MPGRSRYRTPEQIAQAEEDARLVRRARNVLGRKRLGEHLAAVVGRENPYRGSTIAKWIEGSTPIPSCVVKECGYVVAAAQGGE